MNEIFGLYPYSDMALTVAQDFLSPVSEPASEPAEDEDQLAEELDSFP